MQPTEMELSRKQNTFSIFFWRSEIYIKFWTFSTKKYTHRYFWNYGIRSAWLGKCVKIIASQYPSTSNMVNGPKHCSTLNDGTFTILIDHWPGWLSLKKSLLVIWKILKLFLNTFTAGDKCSLFNRDNLTQPIKMQLSHK